jgi:hypothetical protein
MKKRLVAIILACVMVYGGATIGVFADSPEAKDISGHWAEDAIERRIGDGLIDLSEKGDFRPDDAITRIELVNMINGFFGFEDTWEFSFSDVEEESPYADDIGKAVWLEYAKGYDDGTFRPDENASRAEAAVMIDNVFNREDMDGSLLSVYSDRDQIAEWAEDAFAFVVSKGYLSGYPDSTIKPDAAMTRAEALALLDRSAGRVYGEPGVYGPQNGVETVEGNVTVASGEVTLRNMSIEGDLYISAQEEDEDVLFSGLTVLGEKFVRGGGIGIIEYFSTDDFVHELSESNTSIPGNYAYEISGVSVELKDGEILVVNSIVEDDGSISEAMMEEMLLQDENTPGDYTDENICVSFDVFAPSNGQLIRTVRYIDGLTAEYESEPLEYAGDENTRGYISNVVLVAEKDENGEIEVPDWTVFECDVEFAWFYQDGRVERTTFLIKASEE